MTFLLLHAIAWCENNQRSSTHFTAFTLTGRLLPTLSGTAAVGQLYAALSLNKRSHMSSQQVSAPITGVVRLKVKAGQVIQKGDVICTQSLAKVCKLCSTRSELIGTPHASLMLTNNSGMLWVTHA